MKRGERAVGPRARFRWAWFLETPLVLATWVTVFLMAFGGEILVSSLHHARAVEAEIQQVRHRLSAEEAVEAWATMPGDLVPGASFVTRCGTTCVAQPGPTAQQWEVQVMAREGTRSTFAWRLLQGGACEALGQPFSVAGGRALPPGFPEPLRLDADCLPLPQWDAAQRGWTATPAHGVVRDRAVALLRLTAGTDRDDFTIGRRGANRVSIDPDPQGVLRIDGNLWVDRGAQPLVVELSRDTTLLVRGNLYLGRSLRVIGTGRLWLAVICHEGRSFRDLDGNGRWSAGDQLLPGAQATGPMEGSGCAWIGLPGDQVADIEIEAGLQVAGELHLNAGRAAVCGALVIGGAVSLRPDAVLEAPGRILPEVAVESVPGFATVGQPRPSRLVPLQ